MQGRCGGSGLAFLDALTRSFLDNQVRLIGFPVPDEIQPMFAADWCLRHQVAQLAAVHHVPPVESHHDIGNAFGALMQGVDAFLLGRKTYAIHASAFEPMKPGDVFGDMMNAPAKYVVSRTLEKPIWRNTTIFREDVVEAVRKLKAAPGKSIVTDGSHQLVHTLLAHDLVDELHLLLYPLVLGGGKKLLPEGVHRTFILKSATPYPTGVVDLLYARAR